MKNQSLIRTGCDSGKAVYAICMLLIKSHTQCAKPGAIVALKNILSVVRILQSNYETLVLKQSFFPVHWTILVNSSKKC